MADIETLRERLLQISDDLADLAMDRLRSAMEDGATRAPDAEKRITRARRAVEKAAHLLEEPTSSDW